MTNRSLNINEISIRYSNALILAASDKEEIRKIRDNFSNFLKIIEKSDDLKTFIKNPLISPNKKSKVLEKICKKLSYNDNFQGFIIILTKHGKISLINKVFLEFKKKIDLQDGFTEVFITTSEPLEKKVEDTIKNKLSETLDLKIKLNKIINPDIIGGIIIKIKSIMIDNSIKSKLMDYKI
ncbi:MAG: ATP synthase F1 subunit delta [Pseudomonadota bacterium]|nr:ATP synthase F1 subunit delta [Pseudomonadota bacterium]